MLMPSTSCYTPSFIRFIGCQQLLCWNDTLLTPLLSRRRCAPFALTAFSFRGRWFDRLVAVGSGGYYLFNNAAFSLEVSAICVDRFRSSWTVVRPAGRCGIWGLLPFQQRCFLVGGIYYLR